MTTKAKTVELACEDTHGGWEHCGDFDSEEAAIEEALPLAADPNCPLHHDDHGTVVFGVSSDSNSGHYESVVAVYEDGTHTVV